MPSRTYDKTVSIIIGYESVIWSGVHDNRTMMTRFDHIPTYPVGVSHTHTHKVKIENNNKFTREK